MIDQDERQQATMFDEDAVQAPDEPTTKEEAAAETWAVFLQAFNDYGTANAKLRIAKQMVKAANPWGGDLQTISIESERASAREVVLSGFKLIEAIDKAKGLSVADVHRPENRPAVVAASEEFGSYV